MCLRPQRQLFLVFRLPTGGLFCVRRRRIPVVEAVVERPLGLVPRVSRDLAEALEDAGWRVELVVVVSGCRPVHGAGGAGEGLPPRSLRSVGRSRSRRRRHVHGARAAAADGRTPVSFTWRARDRPGFDDGRRRGDRQSLSFFGSAVSWRAGRRRLLAILARYSSMSAKQGRRPGAMGYAPRLQGLSLSLWWCGSRGR